MTLSHSNPPWLPSAAQTQKNTFIRVEENQREEAIERLVGAASKRRFLHYAKQNRIDLTGLWSRVNPRGKLTETILAVPNAGRTAMVFATHPPSRRAASSIGELIEYAGSQFETLQITLGQALIEPSDTLERAAFGRGGFTFLANLSYLHRPTPREGEFELPNWPNDVQVTAFEDSSKDDLMQVLDESYQDTLDCPALCGLRRIEDIYHGHRATGEFDPTLWAILRIRNRPAGVVMLNPSPQEDSIELVYLGLSPFARGRGLGALLLQHGLTMIAGRPERRVMLAVDEANAPARTLYEHVGFSTALRRVAMIRPVQ